MRKPLDFPTFFRPIPITFYVLKLFERIILSHMLFLESKPIFSFRHAGFCLLIKLGFFLTPNKPKPASRTILVTIDLLKAFDSVWHLAFSTNSFRLPSLLCSLDSIFSFTYARLRGLSKSQKSVLSSPLRCFASIRFCPCTFVSFHQ